MDRKWLLPLVCYTFLAACETIGNYSAGNSGAGVESVAGNSGLAIQQGRTHFSNRRYRNAVSSFQRATELSPGNMDAWLGLAASLDMVGKFDDADKAYGVLQRSMGNDVRILNNMGYSQLIRGNLVEAKRYLNASFEADPRSDITSNNLKMISAAAATLEKPGSE